MAGVAKEVVTCSLPQEVEAELSPPCAMAWNEVECPCPPPLDLDLAYCASRGLPASPSPLQRTAPQRRERWAKLCGAAERAGAQEVGRVNATVLVFDDRRPDEEPFLDLNRRLNERCCEGHGFDFVFAGGPGWADLERMPPHWARVAHLLALANSRPSSPSEFVISLDSDAVLASPSFPLRRLLAALPAGKSVFLAKDPPMWAPPEGWEAAGVFCSGFVLIRLDDAGRRFLARWLASYDPGQWWQNEEGHWFTDGKWAGSAYEQGQLNLLAQGEFAEAVLELPQALFNSAFARARGRPQPVVVHLMRRPGEPGGGTKCGRVATAFAALLEAAGAERPFDGIPRDVGALRAWEMEEEAWCCPHAPPWGLLVGHPLAACETEDEDPAMQLAQLCSLLAAGRAPD